MPISRRDQLIFVHIPRCGGSSIEEALGMYEQPECLFGIHNGKAMQHYSAIDYRSILGEETFQQYYKFAVVRNPFSRFISHYYWCELSINTEMHHVGHRGGQGVDGFIDYCEEVVSQQNYTKTPFHDHFMPQYQFIYDENDALLVDRVFKFEKYQKVIRMLKRMYRATVKKHPHTAGHYSQPLILTDVQKSRIAEIYKKDFELLAYSPPATGGWRKWF